MGLDPYAQPMIEVHPFGNFVPLKVKYLMLGSFVTKPSHPYEWFYANGRNQFWPIMGEVYGQVFNTKDKQQQLFAQLEMALADIIYSCERITNSNLDVGLFNCTYNTSITKIIINNKITKIYFTSRYVEDLFRKHFKDVIFQFPNIKLVTLPSPSPRYAMLTRTEKVVKYRELLPRLISPI